MNEIVKYHNNFNSVALKNFNGVEIDLLMAICSKLKNEDINEIKLEFSDLRRMVNSKHRGELRFIQNLEQMYKKLISLSIRIETEDKIINFVLFTKYEILKKQKTILIKINEEFKFLLNKFINNFTRFELNEFISLKSSYSKEIYRRLKQFKHTGIWKVRIDNFRKLLNIPEKYRIIDIDTRVLTPIQKELEQKYNLEITKKYGFNGGRGRSRVVGFEFKFSPEKREKSKLTKKDKSEKSEKKEKPEQTQEKEKTLREKIKEKIVDNNGVIENMEAFHKGIKDSPKLKDSVRKLVKKIEELKSQNVQLKAIYDIDEENFTQEIVDLANELIIDKI